ncbi:MAG: response regulator transcription factor [Niastella sp.]|nr:response regulator transcription factor [Niastella sp.]
MKVLIVDDNKIARSTLVQLASQLSYITIAGECENALSAYNHLQKEPVDLLLLDIEMPGITGIELTRNMGKNAPLVIFITSKKEYAVEAFDLNVVDYIVKPILPARFLQAMERAKEILDTKNDQLQIDQDDILFIRDTNIIRRINKADILFIEAMGDYVKLYTTQKYYAVHSTLKKIEDRLCSPAFIKVHRSYIVAVDKIDQLKDGTIIIGDKSIPVSDAYRANLNARLNII